VLRELSGPYLEPTCGAGLIKTTSGQRSVLRKHICRNVCCLNDSPSGSRPPLDFVQCLFAVHRKTAPTVCGLASACQMSLRSPIRGTRPTNKTSSPRPANIHPPHRPANNHPPPHGPANIQPPRRPRARAEFLSDWRGALLWQPKSRYLSLCFSIVSLYLRSPHFAYV